MVMSYHQNARGQNHNLRIGDKAFENVVNSMHLGNRVANQNCIHEEIKSRLQSGECVLPFNAEFFIFPYPLCF
jgi:hypothetical protein